MKIFRAALAALFILATPAFAYAQGAPSTRALVVQTCGLQTFPLLQGGQPAYAPFTILQNGNLCSSGGGGGSTTDPNNAPYGSPTATPGTTITPGSGTAATPGRVMHYWCPPSTTAGLAYTTYTTSNNDTDNITLQPGAFGDVPANVTYVAAITTVSGPAASFAGCTFKNHN